MRATPIIMHDDQDPVPAVSIIIPTYNRPAFTKKAVGSVLAQTFRDFELIVVDDGSTDGTTEAVEGFSDERLRVHHMNNRGPGPARNAGIELASAQYIAFLDSDDAWVPEKLQRQLDAMNDRPEYTLSHTEEVWYKGTRLVKPQRVHRKREGDLFQWSLKLCSISMSTVIVKRELFAEVGTFDPGLEVCEDYDLWLRVTARHRVLLVDAPLTIKQGGHFDQQSGKYFGLDRFRIYAIEKLLDAEEGLSGEQRALAFEELERKCRIYGRGCMKYGKTEEGEHYLGLPEKYKPSRDGR